MYVYVHSIIKIKSSVILLINWQECQCNKFIKNGKKDFLTGTHTQCNA